jgi:hypothetical protein
MSYRGVSDLVQLPSIEPLKVESRHLSLSNTHNLAGWFQCPFWRHVLGQEYLKQSSFSHLYLLGSFLSMKGHPAVFPL